MNVFTEKWWIEEDRDDEYDPLTPSKKCGCCKHKQCVINVTRYNLVVDDGLYAGYTGWSPVRCSQCRHLITAAWVYQPPVIIEGLE